MRMPKTRVGAVTRTVVILAVPALLLAVGLTIGPTAAGAPPPNVTKVLTFMEENHSLAQMEAGMPYAFSLAQTYGYANNWTAITHPSLPNYIALASGKTYGITDDNPPSSHQLVGPSVFGQARAAGKTAKTYAEGMTSNCMLTDTGRYAVKHNPWAYFVDTAERSGCTTNDVPTTALDADITNGTLPNVGMVVPDLCDDAHDCSLATADNWFKAWMVKIFASPDWATGNLAVVLTADEDDRASGNKVLTVVIHPSLAAKVVTTALTHYSWTRFNEDVTGAAHLNAAATAPDMGTAFGLVPGSGPTPTPTTTSPSPTPTTTTPTPTPTSTPPTDTVLPARGAFSYPWFPEAWSQGGINPATHYSPTLGFYSSTAVMDQHVQALLYGRFAFDVSSWWGQGDKTDTRLGLMLTAAHGTALKIAPYYEAEGNTISNAAGSPNPTAAQITSDLNYLATHYAGDANYMHVGGKPVVFAFGDSTDTCATADRWATANAAATTPFYVVLKVFPGYATCASQPGNWHQYGPAVAIESQGAHSVTISPGFWKYNEATPRLVRDLTQWATTVNTMNCSTAALRLVTTFNEWGEGTSVESAAEWATASGQGGYLDVLHNATTCTTPTPTPTPTPTSTSPTPTPTPTSTSPTPTPTPTPTGTTITVTAAANTFTRQDAPTTNFGTRARWFVDGKAGAGRHSFLRFNLVIPAGQQVATATMRAYPDSASVAPGVSVYQTTGGWTETGLTWATEPARGALVTTKGGYPTRAWVTFDVTSGVPATGGQVNFRLETTALARLGFDSRENTANRPPTLVITTTPTP